MEEKVKLVLIPLLTRALGMLISLYSFFFSFLAAIGPGERLERTIYMRSLLLLFFSGFCIMTLKKWAWYLTLIPLVLILGHLVYTMFLFKGIAFIGFMYFYFLPLSFLVYLLLPNVRKQFK